MDHSTNFLPSQKTSISRRIGFCVLTNGPNDFSVLLEDDMKKSLILTHQMEKLYAETNEYYVDPTKVRIGLPVAARYINGDLSWYRAKVTDIDAARDDYEIHFVDYAHAQNNTLLQMRLLPQIFLQYPPMALHCKLFACMDYDCDSAELKRNFNELIFQKWNKGKCLFSFLTEEPPYYVRVWNIESCEEMLPLLIGATKQIGAKVAVTAEDLLLLNETVGARDNDQFEFVNTLVADFKQMTPNEPKIDNAPKPKFSAKDDQAKNVKHASRDSAVQCERSALTAEGMAAFADCSQEDVPQILKEYFPALHSFLHPEQ